MVLIAVSVVGIVASATLASGRPILASGYRLLILLGVWGAAWVVGVVCVLRLRGRVVVPLVLVVGIALRLAGLAGGPVLSNDLYRYSWDAQVQTAGIDPYRYAPDAAEERSLRASWLWPGPAGCQALGHPPGCTQINREDVRTIYPPVAEGWFTTVYNLAGGLSARYKTWQVAGLFTEVVSLALILRLLKRWGRDRRWVAVYALSPLPVVEVINDGHVDGLAIVLTLAALVAVGRPRLAGPEGPGGRRRGRAARLAGLGRGVLGPLVGDAGRPKMALAGALVAMATLVKLYPAAALLPIVATPGLRPSERIRAVAWFVAVVVVAYLPHVLAVGLKVLGYLPGYLQEEHYAGADRFLIPGSLPLSSRQIDVVVAVALALAAAWVVRRRSDPVSGSAMLLGVVVLCATPVQPWYAILLIALGAAAGLPRWAVVTAAGYPYFFAVILAATRQSLVGRASFGAAAVVVAALATRAGRRRRRVRAEGGGLRDPAEGGGLPGGAGGQGMPGAAEGGGMPDAAGGSVQAAPR